MAIRAGSGGLKYRLPSQADNNARQSAASASAGGSASASAFGANRRYALGKRQLAHDTLQSGLDTLQSGLDRRFRAQQAYIDRENQMGSQLAAQEHRQGLLDARLAQDKELYLGDQQAKNAQYQQEQAAKEQQAIHTETLAYLEDVRKATGRKPSDDDYDAARKIVIARRASAGLGSAQAPTGSQFGTTAMPDDALAEMGAAVGSHLGPRGIMTDRDQLLADIESGAKVVSKGAEKKFRDNQAALAANRSQLSDEQYREGEAKVEEEGERLIQSATAPIGPKKSVFARHNGVLYQKDGPDGKWEPVADPEAERQQVLAEQQQARDDKISEERQAKQQRRTDKADKLMAEMNADGTQRYSSFKDALAEVDDRDAAANQLEGKVEEEARFWRTMEGAGEIYRKGLDWPDAVSEAEKQYDSRLDVRQQLEAAYKADSIRRLDAEEAGIDAEAQRIAGIQGESQTPETHIARARARIEGTAMTAEQRKRVAKMKEAGPATSGYNASAPLEGVSIRERQAHLQGKSLHPQMDPETFGKYAPGSIVRRNRSTAEQGTESPTGIQLVGPDVTDAERANFEETGRYRKPSQELVDKAARLKQQQARREVAREGRRKANKAGAAKAAELKKTRKANRDAYRRKRSGGGVAEPIESAPAVPSKGAVASVAKRKATGRTGKKPSVQERIDRGEGMGTSSVVKPRQAAKLNDPYFQKISDALDAVGGEDISKIKDPQMREDAGRIMKALDSVSAGVPVQVQSPEEMEWLLRILPPDTLFLDPAGNTRSMGG